MPVARPSNAAPAVSVVIPLYNKGTYVAAAIRSVQAQSCGDLELIVVDDGSTDGGASIAHEAGDHRLRLIRQENAGAGAARNAGIEAARGRWVAFLDADDLWEPDRLSRQLALLERHPDVVWAAGAYLTTTGADPIGRPSAPLDEAWFVAPEVVGDALVALPRGGYIWTGTVMIKRRILSELGGFDPTLPNGQDLDLWIRLALRHPRLAYVRTPLARYRTDVRGSLSNRKVRDGSAVNLTLARRLLATGGEVGEPRARLLRRIARRLVLNQAKHQFLAGRIDAARASVAALGELGLGPVPGWLDLGLRLPAGPAAAACRLGIRLNRRLRRLAAG
jgi:glycosyltransferase involved in cell wall biosynthesis